MDSHEKIVPTDEQLAVIDAAGGGSSLMVTAYAGCTKTTTLRLAAPHVRVPALAVAFGAKTAKELREKLPGNFSAKTMNSLGLLALTRGWPQITRFQVEDRKLGKIVSQVAKDRSVQLTSDQWDQVRRLAALAMQAGITPGDEGTPLVEDTRENWLALAQDHLWMSEEDFGFIYDLTREVVERDIKIARESGVITFLDQLYLSCCLGGRFPLYPFIAVDEGQDLSPMDHAILARSMRADARLLVVGDPKQAIYGFRGASHESMSQLRALREAWRDLPLATTFRCPKVIVARQQSHAPGFKAWHLNADGAAQALRARDEFGEGGWTWKEVQEHFPQPRASVAILCRNNAPLLAIAFKLLRQGVGVVMLGRDIGKGLKTLSLKILPEDEIPADVCRGHISEWLASEITRLRASDEDSKVSGLQDRAGCLLAVLASAECRSAGDLRTMLGKLFARESGQVTLGSIHQAKGLEWDLVVHLDSWRIPSRFAKKAAQAGDSRQLIQEFNLAYVCETRTRHTLLNASLEDFNG